MRTHHLIDAADHFRRMTLRAIDLRKHATLAEMSVDGHLWRTHKSQLQADADIKARCARGLAEDDVCPRCAYIDGVDTRMRASGAARGRDPNIYICEMCDYQVHDQESLETSKET